MVLAFLRDALRTPGFLDASAPIYIVEMAAGHGLLTFLFLRRFLPMLRSSSVRGLDVRYVMTDIAESNLTAWVARRPWPVPKKGCSTAPCSTPRTTKRSCCDAAACGFPWGR